MRILDVRRHCLTKKGAGRGRGSHLSAEGVQQARRIGEQSGPYDLVLASHIPRTLETALAMGFVVDDQLAVLGDIAPDVWEEIGHQERWAWDEPFVVFAQIMARGGATARLGQAQRDAWNEALETVPDGGAVLIISHGRVIEAGLVACFPNGEYATWGAPFQHGEGARLIHANGYFTQLVFCRHGLDNPIGTKAEPDV
jgi:broad specificity phosphatase PhoE